MSKKKATGMSKRVSFMDKSVVNENRDILRFNEQLEREARREEAIRNGVPFVEDEPKAPRMGGGRGRPPSGGGAGRTGPSRPRREGPPPGPRPGEVELLAAGEAAEGWAEFSAPGKKMVDQLLRGRKPNPAARFAWELVVSAAGEDADWDDVRRRWSVVHDAILAEWVTTHPEDAPPPPKKKPTPRAARPPRKPKAPGEAATADGEGGAPRPPKPGDEVPGAVRTKRRRGGRGKRGAGGTAPGEAVTTEATPTEAASDDAAVAGTSATVAPPTPHDPPLVGNESPAAAEGTSEQLAPPADPSAAPSDLGVAVTPAPDAAATSATDVPGLPDAPPPQAMPLLDEPVNAAVGTPADPGDGAAAVEAPAEAAPEHVADTPAEPAAEAAPEPVADTPAEPAAEAAPEPVADTPAEPAAEAAPEPSPEPQPDAS